MGIYARVTGDYFLAMQNHTHSAYLAREAGDAQGEAISGFCATMERVNYGLVTIPESVRSMLIELREAGKRLYEALEGKTDTADAIRWAYLNEARKVYDLYNARNNIDFINHKSGHRPTWDALRRAYLWMAEKLGIPQPDLEFLNELKQQQLQLNK